MTLIIVVAIVTSASANAGGGGGRYNFEPLPNPLFKGHISNCMPLSSLLKTVKINGSVECRWCMTKSSLIAAGLSRAWSHDINIVTILPAVNKPYVAINVINSCVACDRNRQR